MAYKTLLTFITHESMMATTLDAAAALARREDAHLEVCCLGVDHTQVGYFYAGAPAMVYQETRDQAREAADNLGHAARAHLERTDIRWSLDNTVVQMGGLPSLVAVRARFADLVVQAKPYGEARGLEDEAVVEAAMFEGKAPVLIVPDTGLAEPFGKRIVAAWNQSNEAMTAIRRALPLLREADAVNIAVIDPPQHGPEQSDPGALLSTMLSRHDVHAEVSVLAKTMPRTSDVIQRHVRDQDADMLVMGAYSHSRFREAILGGTTRHTLEMTEVPVFMAH